MPTDFNDFGRDRYTWMDGQRYLIKRVRTVQPQPGETGWGFQDRMDRFAARLSTKAHVRNVEHEIEKRNGKAVLCIFEVTYEPHIVETEPDAQPAGGRHSGGRGSRAA